MSRIGPVLRIRWWTRATQVDPWIGGRVRSLHRTVVLAALCSLALAIPAFAAPVTVFSTDFESGLPAEFSAPGCVIEGVQGYAGLGPAGRQFGGSFLRYTSQSIFDTKLTVRNLPPHDHLTVQSLLAIIDSWDSTEIMRIWVDGVLRFSHRFSLALADTTTYFPAPPGAILKMGTNLGFTFGSYYVHDRAYDLGVEPAFLDIPHTADTVTVVWNLAAHSGTTADAWQGGGDESWGIDAIRIQVDQQNTGVPSDFAAGRLAISATPNPATRSRIHLTLSLPDPSAARVDLLDLAGRRIASEDVPGSGPGLRSLAIGAGRGIAPGLYLARLTQNGISRTARIMIID